MTETKIKYNNSNTLENIKRTYKHCVDDPLCVYSLLCDQWLVIMKKNNKNIDDIKNDDITKPE